MIKKFNSDNCYRNITDIDIMFVSTIDHVKALWINWFWEIFIDYNQSSFKTRCVCRQSSQYLVFNTPGTAGCPGGSDQTMAVKSQKIAQKYFFEYIS